MSYIREPFENLDVMNFFMFNKLTTQEETAVAFSRCMIRNLLGIEVDRINVQAEKIEVPDDPEKRGVRLDVEIDELNEDGSVANIYDIEPHRDIEANYPKKNRFIQAQIDKNHLSSGENDFSKLPHLFIICITNYDPFGYDQVLYTIENKCIEVPQMMYNDGVRILYFNTVGKKGGSESLKNFLRYLEESKTSNVVDDATREVDSYVGTIKHNFEIGGKYMTLGNLMDKMTAEAVAEAVAETEEKIITNMTAIINEKDSLLNDRAVIIKHKDMIISDKDAEIARLKAIIEANNKDIKS